jgi:ankyrin repeat protein
VQVTRLRRHGFKALHMAAGQNHVEVAQLLLQHGANVKAKSK